MKALLTDTTPKHRRCFSLILELDYADLVALTCVLRRIGGIGGARESLRRIGDAITATLPPGEYGKLVDDAVPLVDDDGRDRAIYFVSNKQTDEHFEKLKAL